MDSSGKERFGYSIKGGQLGAEEGVERLSDGSFKSIGGKVNTPAGHFGAKIGCEAEVCVGGCITINFCLLILLMLKCSTIYFIAVSYFFELNKLNF